MAATGKKFFDDDNDADIICLSSDDDDDPPRPSCSAAGGVKKPNEGGAVNGDHRRDVPALLDMGIQVRAGPTSSSLTNGHKSGGDGVPSTLKVETNSKTEKKSEVVDLDSDSDFEIEYSRNDNDDSDDDIQVIEDIGVPPKPQRKRISSDVGRKEVILSLPGVNLGCITSGGSRLKPGPLSSKVKSDKLSKEDEECVEEMVPDVCEDEPVLEELDSGSDGQNDTKSETSVSSRPSAFRDSGSSISVNYTEESRLALDRFVKEFCARKHRGVKKEKLERVKEKVWEAYNKISHFHQPIHLRLKEEIVEATNVVRCTTDLHWKTLKNLLDMMSPNIVCTLDDKPEAERNRDREIQKMELRHKYEKELEKMQRKIRQLEEEVVDWDDIENDHNSAYVVGDKYKSKLIQAYYTLCDLSNCNHFTGRPIQTKINLRKHHGGTHYDVIDAEVEKFINKRGFMFAPDYTDILDVITKVSQSHSLAINQEEILQTAQQLFENVIKIIKKRREKDFKMSLLAFLPKAGRPNSPNANRPDAPQQLPVVEDDDNIEEMEGRLQDPAEMDAELKAKLEENDKQKKSEADVIDRFCKLAQERGQEAAAVDDENANDSPPPSENDEDEAGDGEEEEDDYGNVAVNKDHERAELTEDEDEEPETVSSGYRGSLILEDDDSNEGKTTTESESGLSGDMDTGDDKSAVNGTENEEVPVPAVSQDPNPTVAVSEDKKGSQSPSKDADVFDDDIQPPPAKRMRPDENCNEDTTVAVESVSVSEPTVKEVPIPAEITPTTATA